MPQPTFNYGPLISGWQALTTQYLLKAATSASSVNVFKRAFPTSPPLGLGIRTTDGELYFGQDGHSYLGIRITDAIDEKDGGG